MVPFMSLYPLQFLRNSLFMASGIRYRGRLINIIYRAKFPPKNSYLGVTNSSSSSREKETALGNPAGIWGSPLDHPGKNHALNVAIFLYAYFLLNDVFCT